MSTLIVHAGSALPIEEYLDDEKRAARLRLVEQIVVGKNIAGIHIATRLDAACSLFVKGAEEKLRELSRSLEGDDIETTLDNGRPVFRVA